MALDDYEHPSCTCVRQSPPNADCPLHGADTAFWGISSIDYSEGSPVRVGDTAPLGSSIRLHADKLILQTRRDLDDCKELLIEARNHAKLTQNLGLVRRIDRKLQDLGVI